MKERTLILVKKPSSFSVIMNVFLSLYLLSFHPLKLAIVCGAKLAEKKA